MNRAVGVLMRTGLACLCVGSLAVATEVASSVGVSQPAGGMSPSLSSGSWKIQQTPSPAGPFSQLLSVSCTSTAFCAAVGNDEVSVASGVQDALTEIWNGTTWSIEPNPAPPGAVLFGVSCPSATNCIAVGYQTTTTWVTLAELWNGSDWSLVATPNPAGATTSGFTGVSCSSPLACTAVGFSSLTAGREGTCAPCQSLAESWNGAAWAIQPTPVPPGDSARYGKGVSCTSPDACTMVGYRVRQHPSYGLESLADAWNGTDWSTQRDTTLGYLAGVSCSSASACVAAADVGATPSVETWDGRAWRLVGLPVPIDTGDSLLNGVSCSSTAACTVVGEYLSSLTNEWAIIAEAWNGSTWNLQKTPDPGGASSSLNSVSCPSSTCIAVGGYKAKSGRWVTLAATEGS